MRACKTVVRCLAARCAEAGAHAGGVTFRKSGDATA